MPKTMTVQYTVFCAIAVFSEMIVALSGSLPVVLLHCHTASEIRLLELENIRFHPGF